MVSPGSSWTDWFTGVTYQGGTTAQVTTDLSTTPVFIRSGGIVTTRTGNVSNDDQNPLTAATVTVAEGAPGATTLYEDDGGTRDLARSATTRVSYAVLGANHLVTVSPADGSFAGQVATRAWTVQFTNASAPRAVSVNGRPLSASSWSWDPTARTVTVHAPRQSVHQSLVVDYR